MFFLDFERFIFLDNLLLRLCDKCAFLDRLSHVLFSHTDDFVCKRIALLVLCDDRLRVEDCDLTSYNDKEVVRVVASAKNALVSLELFDLKGVGDQAHLLIIEHLRVFFHEWEVEHE